MERLSYLAPTASSLHPSYQNRSSHTAADIAFHRHKTFCRLDPQTEDVKLPRSRVQEVASNSASASAPEFVDKSDRATRSAVFRPGARFYLAFSALAALSLVVALDGTSLAVALPVISKDIGGQAIDAFWAGTSFLLASTVSLPIYAALSHIYGRKQITLIAVVLFLIGCLVAGLARNVTTMLMGRSIQGIGGGGIIALTNIILTDLVPLRYRGNWIGVLGAVGAVGSVSGPVEAAWRTRNCGPGSFI